MITKYLEFIIENTSFNPNYFGLADVTELYLRHGYDQKGANIMKKLAIRCFKNKGDEGVIEFLKHTLGVEVFNVKRGKYSFQTYS